MVTFPVSGCGSSSASNADSYQALRQVIEVQFGTRENTIAFQNESQSDATLATGQTVLKQTGINGASEVSYVDLYLYGKKVLSFPFLVKMISNPVNQIVAEGTATPDQSYVNSSGQSTSYNQSTSPSSSQTQADQAAALAKAKADSLAQLQAEAAADAAQQSAASQEKMAQQEKIAACNLYHNC